MDKSKIQIVMYIGSGSKSCRQMLKKLRANGYNPIVKYLNSTELHEDEIKYMLFKGGIEILSDRTDAYTYIESELDDMTMNELIAFIQKYPLILKRPMVFTPFTMTMGYTDELSDDLLERIERSYIKLEKRRHNENHK